MQSTHTKNGDSVLKATKSRIDNAEWIGNNKGKF